MKEDTIFEEISAGAISPQMPHCKAIVINVGEMKGITAALQELFSTQNYRIYVANTTLSKLPAVLERCREAGVPAIVNCGKEPAAPPVWHPGKPYTSAAVVPGSKANGDLLDFISEDPMLQSFAVIGYQGYRMDPQILVKLQKRYFEQMRLGTLRDDITLCEPLVRECSRAFIDMRSVRYSDYPCSNDANPNGMYAEEICTAARYIGMSNRLESIFLYGEECSKNQLTICYKLIAEVIWHICEGILSNIAEYPEYEDNEDYFEKKMVSLGERGQNISFTTSCSTGRWWMEIPGPDGGTIFVPCSKSDYKCACSGEIPIRWLFFYQKYNL